MRKSRSIVLALLFAVGLCGVPYLAHAQPVASVRVAVNGGEGSTPEAQSSEKNRQERNENDAYRHSAMVSKLGGMLGMSPEESATVFEVTNFLLLAIAVLWGVFRIMPNVIRSRNSAIQKHLVDARAATAEASARLSGVESRLGKLDAQIAEMRAQAERDSVRDKVRIKAAVEEEKTKILASAEQEIASATLHARKQLQRYAADLAIEQASRKLVVTAETDRLLVQGFAERIANNSKKGQN